jgi:hypothetical protein
MQERNKPAQAMDLPFCPFGLLDVDIEKAGNSAEERAVAKNRQSRLFPVQREIKPKRETAQGS